MNKIKEAIKAQVAENGKDSKDDIILKAYARLLDEAAKVFNEMVDSGEIIAVTSYSLPAEGDGFEITDKNLNIIKDNNTDLEWYAGPDKDTTWDEAKKWVDNLDVDGGGWRMPTKDELRSIYKDGEGTRNMTIPLEFTGWYVWSSEYEDSSSAWLFSFAFDNVLRARCNDSLNVRSFAVR